MRRKQVAGLSVVFVVTIVAGLAWGDIEGSKHDFSGQSWAGDDACAVCHAPQEDGTPPAAPLWDPNADLTRRFGMPAPGADGPGLGTLSCLQCHDGTVANEAVAGATGARYVSKENPGVFGIAHDATDHPVGIDYPQLDEDYRPITAVIARGVLPLPDGKVECVSCHDPHDSAGVEPMLVMDNARSALCLTCHKK